MTTPLDTLNATPDEQPEQGFLANAPKGKGLTPAGQIAMDPKQTAELLANMQSMVDERTGAFNTFMGGLKDATAWGSGGVNGPTQALAVREAEKNKDYKDVYDMRTQMAAYRAAQAQQEAYNKEQQQFFGGGKGAGAGAPGGGGVMYKGVAIDPETAVAMGQARTREDRDKIFNDFASKRAQARGSMEFGAPSYKTDIKFVNPKTGELEYIDAITAKKYKDLGFGEYITEPTRQTTGANVPVSTRNNNPGNIVDQKTGEIKTYATREEGERALEDDLKGKLTGQSPAYKSRFGDEPVTPARLAETWAPGAAKGNTPEGTANYGKYIAKALNVGANDAIEYTPENLAKIKTAITQFEAGSYAPVNAPKQIPTIPQAEIALEEKKSRATAAGTAAGKYIGGSEATVREAGATSGERLASLQYLDNLVNNPQTARVFGVFQKPDFVSGVGAIVDKGIRLGRIGDIGVDLQPLVIANMKGATQQEIDAAQQATREFAKIKLNEAKIALAGQGAVSDAERGLITELSGSIKNSPGALKDYLAWGKMRAEYDRDVGKAFGKFRGSYDEFLKSDTANDLREGYNDKLYAFAAKKGISMDQMEKKGSQLGTQPEAPKTSPLAYSDADKEKRFQLYKQQQKGAK
jgi:hypothetical protein